MLHRNSLKIWIVLPKEKVICSFKKHQWDHILYTTSNVVVHFYSKIISVIKYSV